MGRKRFYILFSVLLPFAILALAEVLLRVFGYGYDTRLFVADDDKRFLVMNREVSKKYFSIERNATIGNLEPFYERKPEGTLRFFVLGASTSLGFPYMHNGSFPRMVKYKLQFLYPEKNIEVINLSLTAVNSYTLYDFAKRLPKYEPDGVLVYAGQNEYYGALGVASSSGFGRNPAVVDFLVSARDLKIVQLLSSLAGAVAPVDVSLTDKDLTLMERMAARQLVPYDSKGYEMGVRQYERNLGRILDLFDRRGIPVFVGTLVENLKDQYPLDGIREGELTAWNEYDSGVEAYGNGDFGTALGHFVKAKEYDQLRFRAPEAFNDIIREQAGKHGNAVLVDVREKFEENSPHGIVGGDLVLEHVHPNLVGQRLMAECYVDAMVSELFDKKGVAAHDSHVELEDFPHTQFDTVYGNLVVDRLRTQWPFNEEAREVPYDKEDFEYKVAERFFQGKINWGEAMQRLNNLYIKSRNIPEALKVVEQMCLELPYEKMFFKQAGSLAIQAGDKEKAAFYFNKAEGL